jgi:hypothetical protein
MTTERNKTGGFREEAASEANPLTKRKSKVFPASSVAKVNSSQGNSTAQLFTMPSCLECAIFSPLAFGGL